MLHYRLEDSCKSLAGFKNNFGKWCNFVELVQSHLVLYVVYKNLEKSQQPGKKNRISNELSLLIKKSCKAD